MTINVYIHMVSWDKKRERGEREREERGRKRGERREEIYLHWINILIKNESLYDYIHLLHNKYGKSSYIIYLYNNVFDVLMFGKKTTLVKF